MRDVRLWRVDEENRALAAVDGLEAVGGERGEGEADPGACDLSKSNFDLFASSGGSLDSGTGSNTLVDRTTLVRSVWNSATAFQAIPIVQEKPKSEAGSPLQDLGVRRRSPRPQHRVSCSRLDNLSFADVSAAAFVTLSSVCGANNIVVVAICTHVAPQEINNPVAHTGNEADQAVYLKLAFPSMTSCPASALAFCFLK